MESCHRYEVPFSYVSGKHLNLHGRFAYLITSLFCRAPSKDNCQFVTDDKRREDQSPIATWNLLKAKPGMKICVSCSLLHLLDCPLFFSSAIFLVYNRSHALTPSLSRHHPRVHRFVPQIYSAGPLRRRRSPN